MTCLSVVAAAAMTRFPVGTEPVSEILAIPGCVESAAPTSPAPSTTEKSPFGAPDSSTIFASSTAVTGVSSLGLKTMALPAASAGAVFQLAIWIG